MKKLKLEEEWLTKLLPEGLPYPTSTLISVPGGTGKPLVGFGIVNDWLKAGGNVLFIPLQYPDYKFVKTSLKRIYELNIDNYPDNTVYVQFDHKIDKLKKTESKTYLANLLKPEVWNMVIKEAENSFKESNELGTLVFSSALNLLLFSPTYKENTMEYLKKLLEEDKERTYLFNVSTSAFKDEIKTWEHAADNLFVTKMNEDMELYLELLKSEGENISMPEVYVPIEREVLEEIKEIAEGVRKRKIPELKNI